MIKAKKLLKIMKKILLLIVAFVVHLVIGTILLPFMVTTLTIKCVYICMIGGFVPTYHFIFQKPDKELQSAMRADLLFAHTFMDIFDKGLIK